MIFFHGGDLSVTGWLTILGILLMAIFVIGTVLAFLGYLVSNWMRNK